MPTLQQTESLSEKLIGSSINLPGIGRVELVQLLNKNSETAVYETSRPGLIIKTFDLECGKADEVSYGPYMSFRGEVENFDDIQGIEELRRRVPAYYGSNIDYERKFAYIAMEYLPGQNLLSWCQSASEAGYPDEWAGAFQQALYETLTIVKSFHERGIILIDFKPDNVIRLAKGGVKFVDLGSFFTPRHGRDTDNYVYSATPDYAELVIDTSNVQTGLPLTQGSDIFSAGVAFFEMAVGASRLAIAGETAQKMLAEPSLYRFRDSQIKDVWRSYPHLKDLLPTIETQLRERRILFSEFWHLLKSYLSLEIPDWDSMDEEQHRQVLLETGIAFIAEQLPDAIRWLAEPIARSTTLRSLRVQSVSDLMNLVVDPVSELVREDLSCHNMVLQLARDLEPPVVFREPLNAWEARLNPQTGHWALSSSLVAWELRQVAMFTFLKLTGCDQEGHRFYQIVGDLESDHFDGEKLTALRLADDHAAWIGA